MLCNHVIIVQSDNYSLVSPPLLTVLPSTMLNEKYVSSMQHIACNTMLPHSF